MASVYATPDTFGKSDPTHTPESPLMIDRLALAKARSLGNHALAIYTAIIELAEGRDRAFADNLELAHMCGISENTFRKYRALLKEAGLIAQPCEGNGRGLKSVYIILPYSEKGANGPAIVTNITEKGANRRAERVQTAPERVQTDPERVQPVTPFVDKKGANRPEKGANRDENPAHIFNSSIQSNSSSPDKELTESLKTLSGIDRKEVPIELDLAWLLNQREVQAIASGYKLHPNLLRRSLRALLEQWQGVDATGQPKRPVHPKTRIRNACSWLQAGEKKGIHAQWRKDDPYGMAGLHPV